MDLLRAGPRGSAAAGRASRGAAFHLIGGVWSWTPVDGRGAGVTAIRLLLADDQSLVRGALAALLDLEPDFEVVAEVGRGDEVVAAAERTSPDVVLLDVEMPGLDGVSAARALHAAY